MYFVGLVSFYIGYVTTLIVHFVSGLGLNLVYTLGFMVELNFRLKMSCNLKMKFSRRT